MIRTLSEMDVDAVMQIWLETNSRAHSFIPNEYWRGNFSMVRTMLPQAEVYVWGETGASRIDGFIGLMGNDIAGIFVREAAQSKGIGKQLLNSAKAARPHLSLRVYRKNTRAINFYQREGFVIQSEGVDEETHEKEFVMIWSQNAC